MSLEATIAAAPNLIAAWSLGEGSGDFADLLGTHPGTLHGGAERAQSSILPTGEGAALHLDGSSGYVQIEDAADLRVGNDFAYEVWLKLDSVTGFQTLWAAADGSVQIYVDSEGHVCLDKKEILNVCRSAGVLSPDTLYQVVGQKDGEGGSIFINAIDDTEFIGNPTLESHEHNWKIGRAGDSELAYLGGAVQFAALYGEPLTVEEIEDHYEAGIQGGKTGPLLKTGSGLVGVDRYLKAASGLVKL